MHYSNAARSSLAAWCGAERAEKHPAQSSRERGGVDEKDAELRRHPLPLLGADRRGQLRIASDSEPQPEEQTTKCSTSIPSSPSLEITPTMSSALLQIRCTW
jgi:hypothetical protein